MLAAEAEGVQTPEGTPSKTPLKKNKKTLKKPLTNGSRYDIINTERGKENPNKTRKRDRNYDNNQQKRTQRTR